MKKNFKLILIVVFIICTVLAVMVFAGVIPIGTSKTKSPISGTVVLWGTAPSASVATLVRDFGFYNKDVTLTYVQKSPDTLDQDLLEAFADGKGPDLFFLPDTLAYKYSTKLYTIPYTTYPVLNFKNYYSGAGDVFLTDEGVLAFPVAVDPLVMYYNRSILDANGVVYPPAYWDEFNAATLKITKKDADNTLLKSSVALGQYTNVLHAKDIVTTLFMQLGSPIVKELAGKFTASIAGEESKSLGNALAFYTSFADPTSSSYSWNKTLPNSLDAFSAGTVAFYFGYASELPLLVQKNPNQSLGVAPMPQIKNASTKAVKGRVTGIAISSFSKNFTSAYGVANLLASGDFAKGYVKALGIAPVRRDLLAVKPEGVYDPVFYDAALIARSWLDPAPVETEKIFRSMIESLLSNNLKPKDAVTDAGSRINLLFK
jgi:ABC-type glycerol-3-phosphate transport system substrate-binding protein